MRAMKTWRLLMLCSTLLLWSQTAKADPILLDWTFDTIPSGGSVSAPSPGLAQWGYTIQNMSPTLWLVTRKLQSGSVSCQRHWSAHVRLPSVAPGATLSGPLFEFTWDPGVPNGTQNTGFFYLTAGGYDGDPVQHRGWDA